MEKDKYGWEGMEFEIVTYITSAKKTAEERKRSLKKIMEDAHLIQVTP